MENQHLPADMECRYQNQNAGHSLKVRIVAALPGRMYLVKALERTQKLNTAGHLMVHEDDLTR
jgi:hypothetical protein